MNISVFSFLSIIHEMSNTSPSLFIRRGSCIFFRWKNDFLAGVLLLTRIYNKQYNKHVRIAYEYPRNVANLILWLNHGQPIAFGQLSMFIHFLCRSQGLCWPHVVFLFVYLYLLIKTAWFADQWTPNETHFESMYPTKPLNPKWSSNMIRWCISDIYLTF